MSVYDRDYFRDRWDGRGGPSAWGATRWILGLCVLSFVVDTFLTPLDFLALFPAHILAGHRLWELLTTAFCHAGFIHLLFNMLCLWWTGQALELHYGTRRFLALYVGGTLAASLTYVAWARWHGFPFPAVGASGAIMALLVVYAFHNPRQTILIYGIVPMQIRWAVALYALMDLSGTLSGGGVIANAAHLGGAAFGVAWGLWERRYR